MSRQFSQIEEDEERYKPLFMEAKLDRFDVPAWQPALPGSKAKLRSAPMIPAIVQSGRPTLRLAELLDLLLVPEGSLAASQIWKDYSSHLALKLLQLYLTRRPIIYSGGDAFVRSRSRQFSHLSTFLRPIIQTLPGFSAPLDHTLGNLAVALCALFPPVSGRVRLHTEGLSLRLPGLCHRVVGAIGVELLLNVLQHAFVSGVSGNIYLVVGRDSVNEGILLVADNGRGVGCRAPGEGFRLIYRLAGLIGGETVLRSADAKGTEVETRFRISSE